MIRTIEILKSAMSHTTVGLVLRVVIDKEQSLIRCEVANVVEAVARLESDGVEVSLVVMLGEDLRR